MSNRTTAFGAFRGFRLVKTMHGGPPAIDNIPLTSATYYPGQVLRVSATTGYGAKAAAAGTSIAYVTSAYCATADVATPQPVYRLDDFNIFEAKMLVTAAPPAKIGDLCDLAVATTNNYSLQGTASTNVFQIVSYNPDEASTTHTGCRFWAKAARSLWASTKSDVTK